MRIERELMRGAGPVALLKLLEPGEMYGYELVDALARKSGGVLDMGQSTLYPMLYNLQAKGLIRGVWRDSPTARQRRYYSLTRKGRARLAAETRQWQALSQAMAALGVLQPSPAGKAATA